MVEKKVRKSSTIFYLGRLRSKPYVWFGIHGAGQKGTFDPPEVGPCCGTNYHLAVQQPGF
jgi:hypothetical protein